MPLMKLFKSGPSCELLPTLDAEQTSRYKRFRRLLEHNRTALTLQADLEQIYYDNRPFMPQMVEKMSGQFLLEVDGMVNALSGMTQKDYEPMLSVLRSIERSVRDEWSGLRRHQAEDLVLPMDLIKLEQMSLVGAKAANLAHIAGELQLPTPRGFAVTTTACSRFFQETGLGEKIDAILADLNDDDPSHLEVVSRQIRERIIATELPRNILKALQDGATVFAANQQLAVRSSAIGEDGDLSFAGQYSSKLNVAIDELSQAYRHVIASLYSASALSYRMHHGLDDRETPMGVLILAMIEPQYSGVLYTADPANADPDSITISWVEGLGNQLVGGEASAEQIFRVDKTTRDLRADEGSDHADGEPPAFLGDLADYALRIEENYGHPLDIEWAVDQNGTVSILQARPLLLHKEKRQQDELETFDYDGHPVLIESGKCASGGVATGRVLLRTTTSADGSSPPLEPDTILVVRTAATTFTPWVSKVKGIITDVGSSASHLASVAREFGVPALFDTQVATTTLQDGAEITLWAGRQRVYQGVVKELLDKVGKARRPIFHSPAHQRLQRLLDLISPLNLTDPNSADFSPEKCRTAHDIIRFCHEISVRQMFNLGDTIGHTRNAVKLKVNLPLIFFALDMGGGLRSGLTTCDEISVHDVSSIPFVALWRGLCYPGINWSSSVAVGAQDFMALMGAGVRPQDNNRLGGASYAIISSDYLNLSIRFGYHFATVDALCGEDSDHNYVTLNFSGGAGAYHGRSLRIQFLANVLTRLGFDTTIKGDLLEASFERHNRAAMEEVLEQLGRLLGVTRLLDMALKNPNQIRTLTESFFQGQYDFLGSEHDDTPTNFFLITGTWKEGGPEMENGILQDGSGFVSSVSSGMTQAMTRFLGRRYQDFLDNIEAYHYFPLLIARESNMEDGTAQVWVKPMAGKIDQSGGLAFAIRDWANYFVLRINCLENNAVLYEFKNGKRFTREDADVPVVHEQWYLLRVEVKEGGISAFLGEEMLFHHQAERSLKGYLGLWTKADSVTLFRDLTIKPEGGLTCVLT